MIKLIADSGSTKTSWALTNTETGKFIELNTVGYNPYFIDAEGISTSLKKDLLPQINNQSIREIYFYGAGCSTESKQQVIKDALLAIFPEVEVIYVNHDLLASARALLADKTGFAAILGTGANTCIYDGNNCVLNVDSLGYLLGDEGSGSYIGRKLLRDYMRKLMPPDLQESFNTKFDLVSNDQIIKTLYGHQFPNRYLASFCRFTEDHKDHKYITKIIIEAFSDFFENLVSKYPSYQDYSFNCVGSVGYHFKSQLTQVANKYGMQVGKIIQSPMKDLVDFHLNHKVE
jgi:N-acetylglucosamine kinase-like BadF-type ATPase